MPRIPINYANTYFYKLVCKDAKIIDFYIGHTTNFNRRKSEHKSQCIRPEARCYNMSVYQFIRENGGWENFDMIIIEDRKCDDTVEARKIERQYIEELKPLLNKSTPGREVKEQVAAYYIKNKKEILTRKQQYYLDNKEHIKQVYTVFRENNKEHVRRNDIESRKKAKEKLSENKI